MKSRFCRADGWQQKSRATGEALLFAQEVPGEAGETKPYASPTIRKDISRISPPLDVAQLTTMSF